MANKIFVGIDTSNYTTSCAISDENGNILHNFKILLPVSQGERGLRQSEAVFAHIKNFKLISKMIAQKCDKSEIEAIGYSGTPRDTQGSYMPCFLTGEAVAQMLASFIGCRAYKFSHQSGHIRSAIYSSGATVRDKFISFHVSGGTTDILAVNRREDGYYDIEQIGGSVDLHAGQAIDRIGVFMGLGFPCGREMEELASQNVKKVPSARICVNGLSCNLSGLENLAIKLYQDTNDKALVCAYVINFISKTLAEITENIRKLNDKCQIIYAGGVMSNKIIQNDLKAKFDEVFFASPEFSADNAAGIALLARERYLTEKR